MVLNCASGTIKVVVARGIDSKLLRGSIVEPNGLVDASWGELGCFTLSLQFSNLSIVHFGRYGNKTQPVSMF